MTTPHPKPLSRKGRGAKRQVPCPAPGEGLKDRSFVLHLEREAKQQVPSPRAGEGQDEG